MREYCDDADPRPGKWKLVRRRFVALDKAVVRCFDFVAELGGKVPVGAEPVFKSEQDAHEYVRLGAFIAERALPLSRGLPSSAGFAAPCATRSRLG